MQEKVIAFNLIEWLLVIHIWSIKRNNTFGIKGQLPVALKWCWGKSFKQETEDLAIKASLGFCWLVSETRLLCIIKLKNMLSAKLSKAKYTIQELWAYYIMKHIVPLVSYPVVDLLNDLLGVTLQNHSVNKLKSIIRLREVLNVV